MPWHDVSGLGCGLGFRGCIVVCLCDPALDSSCLEESRVERRLGCASVLFIALGGFGAVGPSVLGRAVGVDTGIMCLRR